MNEKPIQIKVGVIVINQDRILLIKEGPKLVEDYRWNIIKGTYDNFDETLFDTAIRECKEEANVEVKLENIISIVVSQKGEKMKTQYNFLAKLVKGRARIASSNDQQKWGESINEVRWFSKKELEKIQKSDFISEETFDLIRDWSKGAKFPLKVVKLSKREAALQSSKAASSRFF